LVLSIANVVRYEGHFNILRLTNGRQLGDSCPPPSPCPHARAAHAIVMAGVGLFEEQGTRTHQLCYVSISCDCESIDVFCSDARVKKVRPNELMFAPFAHIKGSLFTLYDLVVGYTTHILPRFNLNAYLRHICDNKVRLVMRRIPMLKISRYYE